MSRDPKNIELVREFKCLKNDITDRVRRAKANYFETKFSESMGNNKKIWYHINHLLYNRIGNRTHSEIQLLDNDQLVSDKSRICNMFNKYFTGIVDNLQNNLNKSFNFRKRSHIKSVESVNSMFLSPVTNLEIETIISGLRNNTSSGINGISVTTILICPNLIPIFVFFINKSFLNGNFSRFFKNGENYFNSQKWFKTGCI